MLQRAVSSTLELISLPKSDTPLHIQNNDISDSDSLNPPADSTHRKRKRKFGGWQATLYLGSIASFTVLIMNLSMVLWAYLRHTEPGQGKNVLYEGDCDRSKALSSGVHFLINALSTALLSASNFAMQCLSAPTRKDVDRAHARKKWLDIGVPSIRNLWRIPRSRLFMWLCLVWTSVPLHLFYNSTVYSTISANSYDIFVSDYTHLMSATPDDVKIIYDVSSNYDYNVKSASDLVAQSKILERLDPKDCISAYATTFQAKYANVALISPDFNSTGNITAPVARLGTSMVPSGGGPEEANPYYWICKDGRPGNKVEQHKKVCSEYYNEIRDQDEWYVEGFKVDYCLAQRTPERCTLEYSLPLAIVVIGANFVKAGLIVGAAVMLRGKGSPLLTVGDAIASFLRVRDEDSRGRGLLGRADVVKPGRERALVRIKCGAATVANFCLSLLRRVRIKHVPEKVCWGVYSAPDEKESDNDGQVYDATPKRRWRALSRARWVTCLFLYTASLALCLGLLGRGLSLLNNTSSVWTSGLGAVNTETMIDALGWPGGLIPNVLIANIPQLIFSFLYFMSNAILTNMTLASEWDNFALQRKGLRVSTKPQFHQRRTHFLSLPFRFGVPLMLLSALLHWLMSQSIFLVRVMAYSADGTREMSLDSLTVGYSPPAVVVGLCVGLLLPVGLVVLGMRRFRTGMPVAGSCSVAVAAACHPFGKGGDGGGVGIEYRRLKWGVESRISGAREGDAGHCAFSDGQVIPPHDGAIYM
ncbi:uncharacterized protein BDV14DRAFT_207919 [Aspergillus stella-maris]|uniref:uncharacterized protein n=1 Tax=Aspergillus stella-maris TaxID=1810926 RepID=UPI003CCD5101